MKSSRFAGLLLAGGLALAPIGCGDQRDDPRDTARAAGGAETSASSAPSVNYDSLRLAAAGLTVLRGGWQLSRSRSELDGAETVVLSKPAELDVERRAQFADLPTLHLQCMKGTTITGVRTGTVVDVSDDGYGGHTVRFKIDTAAPVTQRWLESTDDRALYSRASVRLARQLARASRFVFEFTPFRESPTELRFELAGLDSALRHVAEPCGWKP